MVLKTAAAARKRAKAGKSFNGVRLEGFTVPENTFAGLDLSGGVFSGVDFTNANLARSKFVGARFEDCRFDHANMFQANMSGTTCDYRCSLRHTNLLEADLAGARLIQVDLLGVLLSRAKLQETVLEGARLSRATLHGANLKGARLLGVDLWLARLHGANLKDAVLPSPGVLLQAEWSRCSPELTTMLMRLDASAHPNPSAFELWANGGPCPYAGECVYRVAKFQECTYLWQPGPPPTVWEAWTAVRAEHCPDWAEPTQEEAT